MIFLRDLFVFNCLIAGIKNKVVSEYTIILQHK